MSDPLTDQAIEEALASLPEWRYEEGHLVRRLQFADFREAMAFMLRVAFVAEAQQHHPELHNVYHRVRLRLSTHEAGDRVTDKDVRLARAIEKLL